MGGSRVDGGEYNFALRQNYMAPLTVMQDTGRPMIAPEAARLCASIRDVRASLATSGRRCCLARTRRASVWLQRTMQRRLDGRGRTGSRDDPDPSAPVELLAHED
jgi:hypothetical protein